MGRSDLCVVNVTFRERYLPYQHRLASTLTKYGSEVDRMFWTDELPAGCPPHQELPYAFKLFAIEEAYNQGYRKILWLDAGVTVLQSLDPISKLIDERGVLIVEDESTLDKYCSDACLSYFNHDREWAKTVHLTGGAIIGLDLRSYKGWRFYKNWWRAYEAGLYKFDRWDESIFGCLVPDMGIELLKYGGVWDFSPDRVTDKTVLFTGYET